MASRWRPQACGVGLLQPSVFVSWCAQARDTAAPSTAGRSRSQASHQPAVADCWQRLLHCYVAELQRCRDGGEASEAGGSATGPSSNTGLMGWGPVAGQAGSGAREVAMEVAAAAGDAAARAACARRVLRHMYGVFLEEVRTY
jgi:hypothetical protein